MWPLGDYRWGIVFGICVLGIVLIYTPDVVRWLRRRSQAKAVAEGETSRRPTVDYIEASAIVDRYIAPAVVGKLEIHKISIRKDFMNRFDKLTGAKIGEYEYNAELLHQWMQSNAARFLIKNRADMS